MASDPPFPFVQNSDGCTSPYSPDHFVGTLVRVGVAPAAALQVASAIQGLLHGAGLEVIGTDSLRAAAGEIVSHGGTPDIRTLQRFLVPAPRRAHPTISLSQLAISLDGKASERSDWGAIKVRYTLADAMACFNVAVDGRWIIRNAPLSPAQNGQAVETLFYFDLGVRPGFVISKLCIATSLGRYPVTNAPAAYALFPVEQAREIYWTNFSDRPYPPLGSPPGPYVGGHINDVFYCRLNYPNQPCGKNECAPTAVSNSLQWLNREYRLNIDPGKMTIDYWKKALSGPDGWDGDGVKHGRWADLKQQFVDKKENGIPIDSTKESGGHAAHVLDEFNGKNARNTPQAVEVDIGSHVASVTCMSGPDDNGHYHLMAASDTAQQGQQVPGGPPVGNPQIQQIEITANGEVVSGPPWANGEKVNNFVVQCPHPGKF